MADVDESTLRTILKNARLRPFKVTYYCKKRNPDFEKKCMMSVLSISRFPCVLMWKGISDRLKGSQSIHCPMTKSPASRRSGQRAKTSRRSRTQKK